MSGTPSVASACLALIAVTQGCPGPADSPGSAKALKEPAVERRLVVHSDGTADAAGVVVSNNRGCEVDARCWLLLDAGDTRVRVVYVEDEGGTTVNIPAAKIGLAVEPGDQVAVYGSFEDSSSGPQISTCADEAYFIELSNSPHE